MDCRAVCLYALELLYIVNLKAFGFSFDCVCTSSSFDLCVCVCTSSFDYCVFMKAFEYVCTIIKYVGI